VSYCHHFSFVVRPSTCHILIFFSETTGPIATKLWWNGRWIALLRNCVWWSRLPTKMAAKLKIEKRGGWNKKKGHRVKFLPCNILVNTLESTSFNGFWPNFIHSYPLANKVARGIVTLLSVCPSVRPSVAFLVNTLRVNMVQWISTNLGTQVILTKIWHPIDCQGHTCRSKVKVTVSWTLNFVGV
jgi:hypothetical protein